MTDAPDDQRFPTLVDDEIARAARFGKRRRYGAGEALFRAGETGIGLRVLAEDRVAISRHDGAGMWWRSPITGQARSSGDGGPLLIAPADNGPPVGLAKFPRKVFPS